MRILPMLQLCSSCNRQALTLTVSWPGVDQHVCSNQNSLIWETQEVTENIYSGKRQKWATLTASSAPNQILTPCVCAVDVTLIVGGKLLPFLITSLCDWNAMFLNESCVSVVCNFLLNPSTAGRTQVYVVGELGWFGRGPPQRRWREKL